MIIQQGVNLARFPVRCINADGDGVTGVLPADISDGSSGHVTVAKADGTTVSVALVNNTNWFEISAAGLPGLYHVLLPSTVTGLVGPIQVGLFPSATAFKGAIFTGEVKRYDDAADLELGRWKIFTTGADANRLVVYRADGTTVLKKFDLKDPVGDPTYTNPFERSEV